jgi:hypothetical protein
MSPTACAVYGLVNDLQGTNLSLDQLVEDEGDDDCLVDANAETCIIAETVSQSETEIHEDDETKESTGDADTEIRAQETRAPQWSIAASKKRAGHAKAAKKARKEAHKEGL